MNLKDFIIGMIATVMGIIAFGVLVRMAWEIWDFIVQRLAEMGYPPGTEYLLGMALLIIAVYLGIVQLKKPRLT